MMELFRVETENQTAVLTSGLLELERASQKLEARSEPRKKELEASSEKLAASDSNSKLLTFIP